MCTLTYLDSGGKFVLKIPAALWVIILQNNGLAGITPTPNPKPNADGSRTVKLTPAQWKIFQDNQKKPPVPAPAAAAAPAAGDNISVAQDASTDTPCLFADSLSILTLSVSLYNLIQC